MLFLINESSILIIYLKFQIQWYITCQGLFSGKGLNSRIKVQKYPIFNNKNVITLIITKEIHQKISDNAFMVQNKTQIASNTHRHNKIVKKILILTTTYPIWATIPRFPRVKSYMQAHISENVTGLLIIHIGTIK